MKIPSESIIENSPYGYALNINHPTIYPLYMRFKRWKEIPVWCPLSDAEREEFEEYINKRASIQNP